MQIFAFSTTARAFARRDVTLLPGDNTLDLELDLAGSIAGTVVDADGHPHAGIAVHAARGEDIGDAVADADGRFEIGALAGGGAYTLSINRQPIATVDLRDGDSHVTGVELRSR
jgi:hypothetical protein